MILAVFIFSTGVVPIRAVLAQEATKSSEASSIATDKSAPTRFGEERQVIVIHEAAKKKDAFDVVEKVVQVLAVLIGATWVWVNYLLNRTHRARLEARVAAEVLQREEGFVKVSIEVPS